MADATIPLFPLHTVLFPGGLLKLRIFEARYVDMVSRCMREDSGFGVVLILEGREAAGPARTVTVGTLARIVDFERLQGGLLGITARGEQRFRVVCARQQSDGLNVAEIEWLPAAAAVCIPPEYTVLGELLHRALGQMGADELVTPERRADADWVGMRLAEILPLQPMQKQELLELDDARERLRWLHQRLDAQ